MSARADDVASLYLPGVEANPQPGIYRDLIEAARAGHAEYSKIWDFCAFQQTFTIQLARFTHGVLRQPASITPGFRELIAAYTSYENECAFCSSLGTPVGAPLPGCSNR